METLYRKVAVSERLPKEQGLYIVILENGYCVTREFLLLLGCFSGELVYKSSAWLEEIPDPTAQLKADKAELLEALEKAQNELSQFKESFGQGSELIPEIESLIQKMKK